MRKSVVIGLCIVGAAIVVAKSRKRKPVSPSPIVPTVDSEIIFEIMPSDDIILTDDPNFDDDFFAEPENWLDPADDLDDTELVGVVADHDAGNGKEIIMENIDISEQDLRCVEAWSDAFECMQDVGGDESQCADLIAIDVACRDNEMGRVMQIGKSEIGYVMQIGHYRSEPIDPIVGRCIGYIDDLVNDNTREYFAVFPEFTPFGITRFDGGIEMTWAAAHDNDGHLGTYHADWLYDFQAALQDEGHTAVVHGDTLHINCAEDGNGTLGFALKRCQDGYMPMNGYCMQQWFQEVIN